jgi:outer membrane lipoprotein LolB
VIKALAWLVPLALAACSVAPTRTTPTAAWEAQAQRLAQLARWDLSGRASLSTSNQAWSGGLHWTHQAGHYTIQLNAPNGSGVLQLTGDPQGVTLSLADGSSHVAQDAEALMYAQLGWQLPVAGLEYWVVGLPAPGAAPPRMVFQDTGQLASLEQAGWTIRYDRYGDSAGLSLPTKLSLQNDELRLRLVIDRWDLPQ